MAVTQSPTGTMFGGLLLLAAGAVILMGIVTAESQYPFPYTTYDNEISDLGATRPPDSVTHQPSAAIFNGTMLVSGAMILAAAYFLRRASMPKKTWVTAGLLGLGVFGVGVFPGNYSGIHPLFALLAFVSGGLAGVLAAASLPAPFRYVSAILGATALGSLVIAMAGDATPLVDELGDGGIERWVAYPVVLWLVAFGGYLAGRGSGAQPA